MADLNDLEAAQTVKIVGATSAGLETNAVNADSSGNLYVKNRDEEVLVGAVTETAPGSDTASSGLNGRLQRIAQRITSLIALIPSVNTIAWFSRISDGTNNMAVKAASTAAAASDPSAVVALSPNSPLPTGTNSIGATTVTGNVASGVSDSGNPVKVGGVYNSTLPTLTDGQRGNNQLDVNGRLKVDANLSSGQLVPTITNKLRIRYNVADVTLPSTNAFQTIYTRNGSGLFFGTQLGFDNANVTIRLTIDGGQIFSLPLSDIKTFEFNDTTDGRVQMGGFLTSIANVFDFSSRFAIPYSSSILIEASASDSTAHKLKRYLTIHTEDT